MKLIFVSGFWVRHLVDVSRDTFAPYTGDLGNLRPEGMPLPFSFIFILFYFYYIDYYYYFLYVYVFNFYLLIVL